MCEFEKISNMRLVIMGGTRYFPTKILPQKATGWVAEFLFEPKKKNTKCKAMGKCKQCLVNVVLEPTISKYSHNDLFGKHIGVCPNSKKKGKGNIKKRKKKRKTISSINKQRKEN